MTEMLEDMNSQPNAAEGFSAAVFYKMGQKYGLTCSEIMVNFLGKARALSRGKYPAVAPAEPQETSRKPKAAAAAAPKPLKAAAKKAAGKGKKAKGADAPAAEADLVETPEDTPEDTADDTAVFTYIATPEEIADSYARPFALPE